MPSLLRLPSTAGGFAALESSAQGLNAWRMALGQGLLPQESLGWPGAHESLLCPAPKTTECSQAQHFSAPPLLALQAPPLHLHRSTCSKGRAASPSLRRGALSGAEVAGRRRGFPVGAAGHAR